jgi:GC-rich sequence DNA-binding factor
VPSNLTQQQEETKTTVAYDADAIATLRASTPSLPAAVKSALLNDNDEDALLHQKFPATMNATIQGVGIPDANAIIAAKKKREQMRKGFNIIESDDGFIPLDEDEEDVRKSRID